MPTSKFPDAHKTECGAGSFDERTRHGCYALSDEPVAGALPLEDYEGHMGSAGANQLAPLADLFGEALARLRPRSVAVLGVAGGNGLEHVDGTLTTRVVGIDVNPAYLSATKTRFPDLRGLELHCARSEERRVGKECRSRCPPSAYEKNQRTKRTRTS